jgi:CRP-like cAMP-binding protein
MSMNTLARAFLRVAMFQGLKPQQMTQIAERAECIVFEPGQVIIENGQPGDTAYLILTGEAVVTSATGDSQPNEPIPEGSLIAEMMMLVESTHTSTVVARHEVRALGIKRSVLRNLMFEDREIAEHFVAKISSRLKQLATALRKIDQTLKPSRDNKTESQQTLQTSTEESLSTMSHDHRSSVIH